MSLYIKKTQVAIVDNDLEAQEMIVAYLKPKGFQVSCFSDLDNPFKENIKKSHEWDILFINMELPNGPTFEFAKQMKMNFPQMHLIMLISQNNSKILSDEHKSIFFDFVFKPIKCSQLQSLVDKIIALKEQKDEIKIIGQSPKFVETLNMAKRVASSSANIFITGESGTGKEVLAKYIHNESPYRKGPFVAINCCAIPESLLESELFGHSKGSFTGAQDKRIGLFEEAQSGTLFLDEIGDLSLSLQAKLLRVLQEKQIKRVGENQYRPINCRIISATHRSLDQEVQEHRFREDLFFRLDVIPLHIPPLRERPEDILLLADFFLKKYAHENSSMVESFSSEAKDFLLKNIWRGNVRELENMVERALILCNSIEVSVDDFMPQAVDINPPEKSVVTTSNDNIFILHYSGKLPSLEEVVYRYLSFAVKKNGGAKDKTAKEVGIDRKTLCKKIKRDAYLESLI